MSLERFHPTLQSWFRARLGEPTAPQKRGWPVIERGDHTLIAAPTGSGKTLAAFLSGVNQLLMSGKELPDETRVLYISPLRALGNDVQKNLQHPLTEIAALDPDLPTVRVLVRTGDTKGSERTRMSKKPPHILVTTPESLYILLTSDGGRRILRTVRTVIVDEIHALVGDKRGSHLALSLERLDRLASHPLQRIGLSATQNPLSDVGHFLVGADRDCTLIDEGHVRVLDLGVEVPNSPLATVCSHETFAEIYQRMSELILEHKTTLIFVTTRKMAERFSAHLTRILGEDAIACHHSSLSKERRLDAEQRLKNGQLQALVATASLELGIDIGDVDLVIQAGATFSIATFLQRVGRAGHNLQKTPKGRIFPFTQEELLVAAALMRSVKHKILDRTPQPLAPLDILAQQIVASCVPETWEEEDLYQTLRKAWPYRHLTRDEFDGVSRLHTGDRYSFLHRDGIQNRLRATRRARIPAMTAGGAIADRADYRVVQDPESTFVGTLDEDFAVESNAGDIVQLGNTSWRILKVESGTVRVANANGLPPTLPFWVGEAPSRTEELSKEVATVRLHGQDTDWLVAQSDLREEAFTQIQDYVEAGVDVLGVIPTHECVVAERFFDESGGMQLVIHAPFGGRINRAWGLALRKRFCRGFGFELQAAANEEAIVLSLGPQSSFPLADVFSFLHANTARKVLVQALLDTPMFTTRWRWNVCRSLVISRTQMGKRVPAPLLRMRAEDELARAFPDVLACGENLPPGDLEVPLDHPLVAQTIEDCLTEAMDVDGFITLLESIQDGTIKTVAIDTPQPSAFARSILSAAPYSFLDDAPLEERRTQAVLQRRILDPSTADDLGALDPEAVRRVREEAWPQPLDAEELHEALLWMGYLTNREGASWIHWLNALQVQGRVVRDGGRWYATEATRDPKEVLRGRLEALGPVFLDDPFLPTLEQEGCVLRVRLDGKEGWCDRRLLARIHRYTVEQLRREIEPVSPADLLRFLACWQHVDPDYQLEGPAGVANILSQLAGFQIPAGAWEKDILQPRIREYQPDWLDLLTLRGEVAWGRLWGSGSSPVRTTPICLIPRSDMEQWLSFSPPVDTTTLGSPAQEILDVLVKRGALFPKDLSSATGLLPSHFELGLAELIGHGLLSSDSFSSLRQLLLSPSKRKRRKVPMLPAGRFCLFRQEDQDRPEPSVEFVAQKLLERNGIVFRRILERERIPVPFRDLIRELRRRELRGDVRGGRFVSGFSGEQFALPEAVKLMRKLRREPERPPTHVAASDPLNLQGILTPDERISALAKQSVRVG